jgi:hypothetical protein
LKFNQNFDNSETFFSNPIWLYDSSKTFYENYQSNNHFENVVYHISVKRQGNGIIIRLVLPITLLLLLAGLTFWAAHAIESMRLLLYYYQYQHYMW